MSVIDISIACAHQRLDEDDADVVADAQIKLNAAEQMAMQFLNRNFYANQTALTAARATVPTLHEQASAAYDAALSDAQLITDPAYQQVLIDAAEQLYSDAKSQISQILMGIVITDDIKGAVLLLFGHLYENREDVVVGLSVAELPLGAKHSLWPHRVGLGV